MSRPGVLALLALAGCISPAVLRSDLQTATELVDQAKAMHAQQCAPETFGTAQAELAFARVELQDGDGHRARAHVDEALVAGRAAVEQSQVCGTKDKDGDGLADIVDQCPDQAEDVDGERDEDGCRDVDPSGDLDRDGVRNIDDDCVEQAEDYDGDHDDDGCPETSEDGDGDGVIDAMDRCPTEAEDPDGFKDADGCADVDNDGDAIADVRDGCPNAPEDMDGTEDADGCPDDDNDRDGVRDLEDNCPAFAGPASNRGCPTADADADGVSDTLDKCPGEKEVVNGWLDDDGCADAASARISVGRTKIELLQPIAFVGDTAEFDPTAFPVLDDVARAMAGLAGTNVRIEGHTEAVGDEAANLTLSRRRAEAVFDWLSKHGVAAERMEVVGLGATKPIDTNRTSSGRARNRRIELWLFGAPTPR